MGAGQQLPGIVLRQTGYFEGKGVRERMPRVVVLL